MMTQQPPQPHSIHTSKRKFYKLLDNLSSSRVQLPSSNTDNLKHASTTTLAATAEPPSKRSRLLSRARPTTAPSSPTRPSTAGARERPRSSVFAVGGGTHTRPKSVVSERDVMVEQTKKTPNYAPWSHDAFLARLKTFADVRNWTPKPAAIGEMEWAKRGWTVVGKDSVGKDSVGCKGGCEKRLVVRVADGEKEKEKKTDGDEDDDWWVGDLESEMVDRYRNLIVEAHAEECLWRKAGCKDDIYRIKMADPATWQTELRERYLSLLAVEAALPVKLDLRPQDMEEGKAAFDSEQLANVVPPDVLSRPSKSAPATETPDDDDTGNINTTALAMALTGWSGQSQNNVHLAYCTKCFQRAGLWLYKPKSTSEDALSDLIFNPIEQHREHCPWKNVHSQAATGRLEGMPGWQVLVTLIKGYRRPDAGSRSPIKKTPSRPVSSYTEGEYDDEYEEQVGAGREKLEKEDKERRSRLAKIKRAFTVKRGRTLSKDAKEKEGAA